MVENRIITPQKIAGDEELYTGLRPQTLDDFVGQKSLCRDEISKIIKYFLTSSMIFNRMSLCEVAA